MLVIRKEQMTALSAYMGRRFEDRMVRHLAQIFPGKIRTGPDPTIGDVKVRDLVRLGVKKSSGYGLKGERNVALFIDLMVGISPGFDQLKEMSLVRAILENAKMPEGEKMDLIYQHLQGKAAKEKA
jgi:hypothetical protein